jgi:transcription elongation GreA/GreB family factor
VTANADGSAPSDGHSPPDTPQQADKTELIAQLVAQLQTEIPAIRQRAKASADAATHEENRPENDKDMRSTEASYVARGQAAQVRDAEAALALLAVFVPRPFAEGEPIALSAIVEVEAQAQSATYFLVPAAGGRKLSLGDRKISSLTKDSPLGRALMGLTEGESAVVPAPQGTRAVEVVGVR